MATSRGDSTSHDLRLRLPKLSTNPLDGNRNVVGVAPHRPGACRGTEREDPCCQAMTRFSPTWEDPCKDVPSPKCGTMAKDGANPSRISHRAARSDRVTTRGKVEACTISLRSTDHARQ
jgi:hypothetical protein